MDITIEAVARLFAELSDEQIDMVVALDQRDQPSTISCVELEAIAATVKATRTAVPQPRKPGRPRGSKNKQKEDNQ